MIHSSDRFGTTWWGRLWLTALEQLGDDYEFRLHRGKQYAEEGVISHFHVQPGSIQAKVHGRKTYEVTLALPALTQSQWERAIEKIALESRFVASLLAGEMPSGLDEIFRESGASLYPRVPKELQTHCTCPDWANPCKHIAAVCYVMAEVLDRDPWILFDLRGKTREEVLASLQALALSAAPATETPQRRRGRPKKTVPVPLLVARKGGALKPWLRIAEKDFDSLPKALPSVVIPRSISSDPSVFVQLGPLPHARIEASICLAALMHRTAQLVQRQIEDGVGAIEDNGTEQEAISPFETPLPPQASPRAHRHWRHHKRRRWQV